MSFEDIERSLSSPLDDLTLEQQRQKMTQSFVALTQRPPGNEETVREFGVLALDSLQTNDFPAFTGMLDRFLNARQSIHNDYKVQLLWRVLQFRILESPVISEADIGHYPTDYNKKTWRTALELLFGNVIETEIIDELLATADNQSTEPRRYAGVKIALAAHGVTTQNELTYLDVGCSSAIGTIQLVKNFDFKDIGVNHPKLSVRNQLIAIMHANLQYRKAVAMDKLVGVDPAFAEACAYPSEVTDTVRAAYRAERYRKRNIQMVNADLLKARDLKSALEANDSHRYDFVSTVTMRHQLTPKQDVIAERSLRKLAKIAIISQEFAEIDSQDPTKLITQNDLYDPNTNYNLFSQSLADGNTIWLKLGTWDSGRSKIFTPSPELLERI